MIPRRRGRVWQRERVAVYERDGGRCQCGRYTIPRVRDEDLAAHVLGHLSGAAVCGLPIPLSEARIDHVHELQDGGPDHRANLSTLCRACHRWKTAATRIGRPRPRRAARQHVETEAERQWREWRESEPLPPRP